MNSKKISLTFVIILFSFCFSGCSSLSSSEGSINYTQQTETLTVGSLELSYGLALPDLADEGNGFPLILALHYSGNVTPSYGREFMNHLILPALSELGAVIVSPSCPSANGWANSTSKSAILALIDEIKSQYNINESQVIVTGYSMGGNGTWYYATYCNDIFSAAVPIASLPESYVINNIENIPVYAIHGMMDEIFDYRQVEAAVSQMENRGVDVQLHAIGGLGHYAVDAYIEPLKRSIDWIRGNINL